MSLPTVVHPSLLSQTETLMRNRPRHLTYAVIADHTGIKASWLELFARGRINDPGVRRIEKIFTFLANQGA